MSEEHIEKAEKEEQKVEQIIEHRKEKTTGKLTKFVQNKYNFFFVVILIFALAIRLYYFFVTKNQVLWWDEAEYALMAKSLFLDIPTSGVYFTREPFVPLLWGLLLGIFKSEIAIRLFQNLTSVVSVGLTYFVGKKLYDAKVGLIAAFAMSVFWLDLFYTNRLLLNIWPVIFYLLIIFFFRDYYYKERKVSLYISGGLMGVGLFAYFSIGFILPALLLFYLIADRKKLLKKETGIAVVLIVLAMSPFMYYSYSEFGSFIPRLTAEIGAVTEQTGQGFSGLFVTLTTAPDSLGYVFLILSAIGLLLILTNLIIGYDLIPKFMLPVFPFVFMAMGKGILYLNEKMSKKIDKKLIFLAFLIILLFGGYLQLSHASKIIELRVDSYASVRDAGLWIKENSELGDLVITDSLPQITYYSERESVFSREEAEVDELMKDKDTKYLVVSAFENSPEWYFGYPTKHNLTAVQAYFTPNDQPLLAIYDVSEI